MVLNNAPLRVSVVIPVHNGGKPFEHCIKSVIEALGKEDELIVVVDGGLDNSHMVAKQHGARVISIPNAKGPAIARNIGASKAKGDILFFTDADVTIPNDTLLKIKVAFHRDKSLAALFGSYDDSPFEKNLLSQYRNLLHHYVHQTAREDASSFWTGCGAILREVFLKMGGFNEAYRFPSIEDIELGTRMKQKGLKITLKKDIQVKHLKRWSLYSMFRADFFYRALPWTALILKERLQINDLNLKLSAKISTVLVLLMLISLFLSLIFPLSLVLVPFFYAVLFILNWDLYRFFNSKRGVIFTVEILFFHWMYFFYSGLAYAIGYLNHRIKGI